MPASVKTDPDTLVFAASLLFWGIFLGLTLR